MVIIRNMEECSCLEKKLLHRKSWIIVFVFKSCHIIIVPF